MFLPNSCWVKTLCSASFILNGMPYKNSKKTPCKFWKNQKPSRKYLKVWGCLVKVNNPAVKKKENWS